MEISTKTKILLVEDDAVLSQMYLEKLDRVGFTTATAENGEKGLDAALRDHPDIILLDLLMPKMDGITLEKKLREDQWGKLVPVIILTNLNVSDKHIFELTSTHQTFFFMKTDITPDDVVEKIKEVLKLS
jgi:two-component system response regulator MprA